MNKIGAPGLARLEGSGRGAMVETQYVWTRLDSNKERFDDVYGAGVAIGSWLVRADLPIPTGIAFNEGKVILGTDGGKHPLPLYWGDEDGHPVDDAVLSRDDMDVFEEAVMDGYNNDAA